MNPDKTVYVDMDGVLVNFLGGVLKHLGKNWDQFKGEKDKRDSMTFGREGFWESLPPMKDAQFLWWSLAHHTPHILTAYPYRADDPKNEDGDVFRTNARVGKWGWLQRHQYGVTPDRFHCVNRKDKKAFAVNYDSSGVKLPNILIDDNPDNIKEWRRAGGHGILHTDARSTVKQMKEYSGESY